MRFMLLMQIMHNYLMWLLHSLLARAPYVVLFDLKPQRWQLAGRYILCACNEKGPQEPPDHTPEHVSLKVSWGNTPRPPSHNPFCGAPLFVFSLGPPNSLSGLGMAKTLIIAMQKTINN